jgi:hypothetical protein
MENLIIITEGFVKIATNFAPIIIIGAIGGVILAYKER